MRQFLRSPRDIAVVAIAALAIFIPAFADAQQRGPLAEQQYKNIQVLKGIPASQLIPTMHLFAADLGEPCAFCHVVPYFEKDDKAPKKMARRMIVMMNDINKNFAGVQMVTCYTCHRGTHPPANVPVLPVPEPANPKTAAASTDLLPTCDQILDKYVRALGGEQALRKVKSRVITATQDIPISNGGAITALAKVKRFAKAPDFVMNTYRTDKLSISDGFDGSSAWVQAANGLVDVAPDPDQARVRRGADFYESLNLRKEYKLLEVQGTEKLNGRDTYLVVGYPEDDTPEQFYFDKETGLLLRKAGLYPTAAGNIPYQIDYGDYRDTGSGVKIPFLIKTIPSTPRYELFTSATFRVDTVEDNTPLEDSTFIKPKPSRGTN